MKGNTHDFSDIIVVWISWEKEKGYSFKEYKNLVLFYCEKRKTP